MPPDDPLSLPDPPPSRPDRREAAINAALRKFDGDLAPARPARSASTGGWWSRSRQPQFAMAISLALIAVIGVPATWIVIQDGQLNPSSEPSRSASDLRPAAPPAAPQAPPAALQPAQTAAKAESPPESAKQNAVPPLAVATEPEAKVDEAPAAQLAAAPPPPPPPPPPPAPSAPALTQKSADRAASGEIVLTGSRIARPRVSAERDADALNGLPMREEARAAPGWVMQDRAYRTFLTQLQSAVRAKDRDAVVRLVALPLRVNANGKSEVYPDAASVRRNYARIFTPNVTQAILDQRFERLFGRDQGVMIGDGQLWFDHSCTKAKCASPGPVRITAVNP